MTATWQDDGLCREIGDALFFPDDEGARAHRYTDARAVCAACPVRSICLEDAMAREGNVTREYRAGLWGGLSPEQRANLAKARQASQEAAA